MTTLTQKLKKARDEIHALKTITRRGSTAIGTTTQTVSVSTVLQKNPDSGAVIKTLYISRVQITPADSSLPFFYTVSRAPASARENRAIFIDNRVVGGIKCMDVELGDIESDYSMASGATKTVNTDLYITTTQACTITVTQIPQ